MSNLPATQAQSHEVIGLEDFDESDLIMPRFDVVSRDGVFQDNLTNERHQSIEGVGLGVVKQRIMWDPDQDDKFPWCKSVDFLNGNPHPEKFPWAASGFDKADYPAGAQLPCVKCPLQNWGTNPKNDSPWCSEQHTYIIMQAITNEFDEQGWAAATMTVQRTGLKNSRAYMNGFKRTETPMFIAFTTFGLDMRRKGSNDYSVPTFTRGGPTPVEHHETFAKSYIRIRNYLRTLRSFNDEGQEVEIVDEPVAAPAGAPQPVTEPAPVVVQQPVAPEPEPQPTPEPQPQPAPQPQQTIQPTQAAPIETTATVQPQPAAQPAPTPAPSTEPANDDLPF